MKTFKKFSALLMIALMSFGITNIANAKKFPLGYQMIYISGPNYGISNFPLSLRSVPRHINDGWLTGYPYANNILPNDTLGPISVMKTMYVNGYVSFFDIASAGLSFVISNESLSEEESCIFLQNQYGDSEDGRERSLRYYKLNDTRIGLGFYGSIAPPTIPIVSASGYGIFGFRPIVSAVYQFIPSSIPVESGWYRYQKYEKWNSLSVGTIQKHYINYGLEINLTFIDKCEMGKFSIYVGYVQTFIEHGGSINYIGNTRNSDIALGMGMEVLLK